MANRLLDLAQQKTAALDSAKAVLAKGETEKRAATTEEQASFDGFIATAESVQATIDREQKLTALGGNAYTDKKLGAAGIQVHDNILERPWGDIDYKSETDPRKRRTMLVQAFGHYLKAVQRGSVSRVTNDPVDERLLALNDGFEKRAAAAGASEAVPSDGGFLIAPDFMTEILQLVHETGLVYPRTRKVPVSDFTNSIKIPAIDEQSRKDGYRWGGVQMFWEQEAQQLVGSKPTFNTVELITKKLTGLYYATNEVLADARALGGLVMTAFGEEMGFKLDAAVISGTGAGQPLGILNSPALVTIAKEVGQATQTVTLTNVQKMWGRMWPRSRRNAAWLINVDVQQQLFGLSQPVGTGGIPVYLPPGSGIWGSAGGAPLVGVDDVSNGMLFGRPVITIEQASTLGTVGDIMLVDLNQYLWMDKGDMQTASSAHVRFLTDEMTYRWIYRCDGQSWWKTPILPFSGTNTLSPWIVLASR